MVNEMDLLNQHHIELGENKMAKVKLSKLQKAYREFFKALMDEYGVKSPVELKDKRSEFFNRVKKEWPAAKKKIKEGVLRQEIRAVITEVLSEAEESKQITITDKSGNKLSAKKEMTSKQFWAYEKKMKKKMSTSSGKTEISKIGADWKKGEINIK